MSSKLKLASAAVILLLGALGGLGGMKPALAGGCSSYDCVSEVVVYPQPFPYAQYHYIGHGPDHDYSPMDFNDGHNGHIPGQSYWGGLAWGHVPARYYDQYRGGRW
jgi:hypothetical protein